jgi:purine-nucleoside phosphorylase
MSRAYSEDLRALARACGARSGIDLAEGVYAGVAGPELETAAEYRMLETLGADIVGMSTVSEVIVAGHMGIDVLALSIVSDVCRPDDLQPIDYRSAMRAIRAARPGLFDLLERVAGNL